MARCDHSDLLATGVTGLIWQGGGTRPHVAAPLRLQKRQQIRVELLLCVAVKPVRSLRIDLQRRTPGDHRRQHRRRPACPLRMMLQPSPTEPFTTPLEKFNNGVLEGYPK